MEYIIDFLEQKNVSKTKIFESLNCNEEDAKLLRFVTQNFLDGVDTLNVSQILVEQFGTSDFKHLRSIGSIKNLIKLGWLVEGSLTKNNLSQMSDLELFNASVSLSPSFIKLLENKNKEDIDTAVIEPYNDHLEYLNDQFMRIELYQKISSIKQNIGATLFEIGNWQTNLSLLEDRISKRLLISKQEVLIESLFKENELSKKEQILFLALLKEEYSGETNNLREMNALVSLISSDEYERIRFRTYLDDNSKLVESGLVDYDEMMTIYGGMTRTFFVNEDVLDRIMYPQKEKKNKKIKLETLIEKQEIFELIDPKTSLEDVVMSKKTKSVMEILLKQMDKKVISRLRDWGIKDKRKGIDARIIFYGPPGTGKTMTALSLAKSLKKRVLSFDCSKILSKYVGESEQNVRKIFDTYKELSEKTASEPLLLLNEADQFLSSRTTDIGGSADKMHNQMQNIFLEQIEKFNGILVATTNLLETIDPAFSRRFDHKISFEKPDYKQRLELWRKILPENAEYAEDFSIEELAKFALTGGQISLVLKNTALGVAIKDEPIFTLHDFTCIIERELKGAFGENSVVGFIS